MNKILYFSATWCGPCKVLGPTIDRLKSEGLPVQKIDIDKEQPTSSLYNIKNVPTLIKTDSVGNELKRLVGNQSADIIKNWYNN
mgnify:CR=1 FL=1|jgi:thiol-disulfide isomerase/thioredoxin|tara:strand:+ start:204 stop:455 length:252 start_codon:yes stop_codon:yes gene_type:complete